MGREKEQGQGQGQEQEQEQEREPFSRDAVENPQLETGHVTLEAHEGKACAYLASACCSKASHACLAAYRCNDIGRVRPQPGVVTYPTASCPLTQLSLRCFQSARGDAQFLCSFRQLLLQLLGPVPQVRAGPGLRLTPARQVHTPGTQP